MSISKYQVFLKVVSCGTFTKAAEALNFTQSGISHAITALESELGDGLVITQLDGLHAGANVTSGDFSLLSKGYLLEDGKRVRPVEQITIAGNFYELLKNIRAVGSDLVFPGSGVGAPSLDVGELTVSGK